MMLRSPGSLLPVAFLLIALAVCAIVLVDAEDSQADVEWTIDDGHMTVTGTGVIPDGHLTWSGITSLDIGPGVTGIADFAFRNCMDLETVTVQGDLDYMGELAFGECFSMTSFTANGSVGDLADMAFVQCSEMVTWTVHGSVGVIGDQTFSHCSKLVTWTVNGSVSEIGHQAFVCCDELRTVTVNGSVGNIVEHAFSFCENLETFAVGGDLGPHIGDCAFKSCYSLASFYVPTTVTEIGDEAFDCCWDLATIYVPCENPLGITKGSDSNGEIAKNAENVVLIHEYSAAYNWSEDGKGCDVHMTCAKGDVDDTFAGNVSSKVIAEPTETEMGTTEYSVSGTYDGFDYYSKKDVQDIPATGDDSKKDRTWLYVSIAVGAIVVLALAGAAFFLIRRH